MKLHQDKQLFAEIISLASEHPVNGGLGIGAQFIERDYWITNALSDLSKSPYKAAGIFKGGTSLSKAYHIGYRLSDVLNIDVIRRDGSSNAKFKETLRAIENIMSANLIPKEHPVTSKVSVIPGQILLEITSIDCPLPYQRRIIKSFAYDYLISRGCNDIIRDFDLEPFEINVLDKRTTMTTELISLIRSSLTDYPIQQLETKICCFYDLHFLYEDKECKDYLSGDVFIKDFISLYNRDRRLFNKSDRQCKKRIIESPLITDLNGIWKELTPRYYKELTPLSYSLTIPTPEQIESSIREIKNRIKSFI